MIEIYNGVIPGFDDSINQRKPCLDQYLINDDDEHPAFIICPGGAYTHKAEHEGWPIAKWLNTLGINAFVLDYRVFPYKHPYPMLDVQRAIRFVRYNHKEFNIDPHKIGVIGFSAGGHLAASTCVHFDDGKDLDASDEIDKVSCKPDMSILCYPVITFGEFSHKGSKINLLGENASDELVDYMSVEKQVKKDTPPAFIWHTATDDSVPMQNSLLYASALRKNNIPFELHIFPKGRHGLGLKDEVPYVTRWAKLCEDWLHEMNFLK